MINYIIECPLRKQYYDEDCSSCDEYGRTCRLFQDYGPVCLFAEDLQFRAPFTPPKDRYWDGFEFLSDERIEKESYGDDDDYDDADLDPLTLTQEELRRSKLYASRLKNALAQARNTIKTQAEAAKLSQKTQADLVDRCRLLQEGLDHILTEKNNIVQEMFAAEEKWQKTLSDAQENIDNLKTDLEYANMLEEHLTQGRLELLSHIKSLKCSVASSKQWTNKYKLIATEKEREYDSLLDKYNALISSIQPLKEAHSCKLQAYEENLVRVKELETQVATLQASIQTYETTLSKSRMECAEQATRIAKLNADLHKRPTYEEAEQLRADNQRMTEECNNYKVTVSMLTKRLNELETELVKSAAGAKEPRMSSTEKGWFGTILKKLYGKLE